MAPERGRDLGAGLHEAVEGEADIVDRPNLDHDVVDALAAGHCRRDRNAVMTAVAVEEGERDHHSRRRLEQYPVREPQPEHGRIEGDARFRIGGVDDDMAEAAFAGDEAAQRLRRVEGLLGKQCGAVEDLDADSVRILAMGEIHHAPHGGRGLVALDGDAGGADPFDQRVEAVLRPAVEAGIKEVVGRAFVDGKPPCLLVRAVADGPVRSVRCRHQAELCREAHPVARRRDA